MDRAKRCMAPVLAAFGLAFGIGMPAAADPIPGTNSAPAAVYEVNVLQAELCRSAACTNPYILGSGNQVFDIGSVSAGAEVGQFVDLQNIPLFETWSHVRVTLDTTFTIQGGDANCQTGGGPGTRGAFLAGVAGPGNGTPTQMELPNEAIIPGAYTYASDNIVQTDGDPTFMVTVPLTQPYTCTGEMPRIEVQFDTSQAFGYNAGGGCGGAIFPQPPTITVTAFDP